MITCEARPGTCEFIPQLLGFVGLSGLSVEIDRGCAVTVESDPSIIIHAPEWMIVAPDCCNSIEDCPSIPEVECMRKRYFPAGVDVIYKTL